MKYVVILIVLLCSCKSEPNNKGNNQLKGEAFGTYYYIKSTDDKNLSDVKPSIVNLIDSINMSMSTYIDTSIISKLNKNKSIEVDQMFIDVYESSRKIYRETDGYFDPTAGILVNYYGFGSQQKDSSDVKLDSLKKFVGFDLLQRNGNTINKKYKQIYIDFNSIAKGYAVDQFVYLLKNEGFDNFLIDIGGEVYANGIKKKDQNWKVGIDRPIKNSATSSRELSAKIKLQNKAMATSGNYRKYKVNKDTGKETVHTINPISGKATPSSVLSATVIADNCMNADAYATALMAMGNEKALHFLNDKSEIEAYLIFKSDDGKEKTFMTKGFKELIID